ncbi:hypothetical protein HNQ50_001216 [Silvimonas terrae]|uniref:Porin n=1 Tax=Silvimonas terrae TaxID=300266 RepID=A0A840RD37_9NEIS|nr:oligogalacturonate-specific porin KdgM family protein [Silvimonas terrae]MBB5190494.1 hypothetical protein [Silvimonas terrae]
MGQFTRNTILVAFVAMSVSTAYAFDLDIRGEYRTGSEQYRSRAKIANQWSNNVGASLEAGVFNGQGSLNKFKSDFNEVEGWYLYKPNTAVAFIPGADWTWNTSGSTIKPFLRVNWAFAPTWRADVRARYDHNNYDSVTKWHMPEGQSYSSSNDQWQFDFWLTKWIGDKTAIEYNYAWNKKDDSQFVYNNGHTTQYLHNLKTSYKYMPTVVPYFEVGYLGHTADLNNDQDEWRLRIGTVFTF